MFRYFHGSVEHKEHVKRPTSFDQRRIEVSASHVTRSGGSEHEASGWKLFLLRGDVRHNDVCVANRVGILIGNTMTI